MEHFSWLVSLQFLSVRNGIWLKISFVGGWVGCYIAQASHELSSFPSTSWRCAPSCSNQLRTDCWWFVYCFIRCLSVVQLPPSMVTGRTDSIHLDTDSVLEARRSWRKVLERWLKLRVKKELTCHAGVGFKQTPVCSFWVQNLFLAQLP